MRRLPAEAVLAIQQKRERMQVASRKAAIATRQRYQEEIARTLTSPLRHYQHIQMEEVACYVRLSEQLSIFLAQPALPTAWLSNSLLTPVNVYAAQQNSKLCQLPTDSLNYIFTFLNFDALVTVALTCRALHTCAQKIPATRRQLLFHDKKLHQISEQENCSHNCR